MLVGVENYKVGIRPFPNQNYILLYDKFHGQRERMPLVFTFPGTIMKVQFEFGWKDLRENGSQTYEGIDPLAQYRSCEVLNEEGEFHPLKSKITRKNAHIAGLNDLRQPGWARFFVDTNAHGALLFRRLQEHVDEVEARGYTLRDVRLKGVIWHEFAENTQVLIDTTDHIPVAAHNEQRFSLCAKDMERIAGWYDTIPIKPV